MKNKKNKSNMGRKSCRRKTKRKSRKQMKRKSRRKTYRRKTYRRKPYRGKPYRGKKRSYRQSGGSGGVSCAFSGNPDRPSNMNSPLKPEEFDSIVCYNSIPQTSPPYATAQQTTAQQVQQAQGGGGGFSCTFEGEQDWRNGIRRRLHPGELNSIKCFKTTPVTSSGLSETELSTPTQQDTSDASSNASDAESVASDASDAGAGAAPVASDAAPGGGTYWKVVVPPGAPNKVTKNKNINSKKIGKLKVGDIIKEIEYDDGGFFWSKRIKFKFKNKKYGWISTKNDITKEKVLENITEEAVIQEIQDYWREAIGKAQEAKKNEAHFEDITLIGLYNAALGNINKMKDIILRANPGYSAGQVNKIFTTAAAIIRKKAELHSGGQAGADNLVSPPPAAGQGAGDGGEEEDEVQDDIPPVAGNLFSPLPAAGQQEGDGGDEEDGVLDAIVGPPGLPDLKDDYDEEDQPDTPTPRPVEENILEGNALKNMPQPEPEPAVEVVQSPPEVVLWNNIIDLVNEEDSEAVEEILLENEVDDLRHLLDHNENIYSDSKLTFGENAGKTLMQLALEENADECALLLFQRGEWPEEEEAELYEQYAGELGSPIPSP